MTIKNNDVEPVNGEETEEEKAAKAAKDAATAKAADLNEDDLQKSLNSLIAIASEGDEPARKQVLLQKAQVEELDKAERDELFDLMGTEPRPDAKSLGDTATAGLADNETIVKSLEVSDFLREQTNEMVKALGVLAERIEGIDTRQHEFNLILAKAVANEGAVIHEMGKRLGVIENQPASAPKSKGVNVTPLSKSFGDGPQGPGGELSKSEVMGGLESMLEKSVEAGEGGVAHGYDLAVAVSKFEQFNQIDPRLLEQVQTHIASRGAIH